MLNVFFQALPMASGSEPVYLDRGCGGFPCLDKETRCHMTFQHLPKNRLAGDQEKVGVPS